MKGNLLILTHRNTDLDGFASVVLLYRYLVLRGLEKEAQIAIPEGPSKLTRDFLAKANINMQLPNYIEDPKSLSLPVRNVVLLDVSSIAQVGDFAHIVKDADIVIVVDHHSIHRVDTRGETYYFVDQNATSTCEVLLLNLEEDFLTNIEPELATLAIAAILVDSKRLSRATPRTFLLLSKLLERSYMKFDQINQILFQREMPFDEKMARIKGIMRTEAYRFDSSVLCVSHVSAHEASLARLLLEAGCDIVVVVSEHDDEFRVIARTRLDNISMADLCKKIAEKFGGVGGGHAKAGAASIKQSENTRITLRRLMRESINVVSELIGRRPKKVRP